MKRNVPLFVAAAFLCASCAGCERIVFDAASAQEKPLASVVATENSGVASVYVEDAETGEVSVSPAAKGALDAAQTAANASGNGALIALSSLLAALVGAGASFVASRRKTAKKTAEQGEENA